MVLIFDHSARFQSPCHFCSVARETPKCEKLTYCICFAKAVGLYECDRYLKTRGRVYTLCPVFGMTQSSISDWLHYSLTIPEIVVTDKKRSLFAISWPTSVEMEASSQLLLRNWPNGRLLRGFFAVTDGARMPCAEFTDPGMQNAYYEGYTQSVEVTKFVRFNLFVWNFAGELIHAAINFPGSWHDSRLASASGLYWPMLSDEHTPPGYAILEDSAFVNNYRMTNGKVIRSRKTNEMWDVPQGADLAAIDLIMQRVMPSER